MRVVVGRTLGRGADPGDEHPWVAPKLLHAPVRAPLDEIDRPVVAEEGTHRPPDGKAPPSDRRDLREAGLGADESQGLRTRPIDRAVAGRHHWATARRDAACVAAR